MERVSHIMNGTLDGLGLRKKYRYQYVIMYWKQIVGSEIGNHSYPVNITKGVMTVHASNSVWMHHLFLFKKDIIQKINSAIGENLIYDIHFRAGPIKEIVLEQEHDIAPLSSRLRGIRLTKEEVEEVKNLTSMISCPLLKKKLTNILYKNKAYRKLKTKEGWQLCLDCGISSPPGHSLCMVCETKRKNNISSAIIFYLKQAPWHKYNECSDHIPCSMTDFLVAKQQLIDRFIQLVKKGQASSTDESTLVMLTTGLSPMDLTDNMIQQQIAKFGRKKDVSSSRQ